MPTRLLLEEYGTYSKQKGGLCNRPHDSIRTVRRLCVCLMVVSGQLDDYVCACGVPM